ncbi:MAG: DNA-3-methyladenine glycosylase I [Candidatus Nitricoxidivorans perseverans]|uniref:DNA-3-methyladenine glycosylase I n=1 Tax=Candidatus Nitricoxidivorans perseverans TaxID=2975601 RepID=A0AA49FMA8_9PROT|nr:MAG: DNA-3-methyladenine glycosylase I [Candidatus Nitricoxidivorans perseverans]
MSRCPWCGSDPLYVAYHDEEWGVPCHDDRTLFEFLILEGAQAGLSWLTVLKKRGNYRRAFDRFDAERIARYTGADVSRLLADPGIVRNRLKIEAAIANARACLSLREQAGSLDAYLWGFVDGRPVRNAWRAPSEVPVTTPAAAALSRDLARRGFRFVGPTISYSLMQAVGLVNDHLVSCFRHGEISRPRPLPNR